MYPIMKLSTGVLAMLALLVSSTGVGQAAVTPFTDETAFLEAIDTLMNEQTEDLEGETAGTPLMSGNSLNGITYDIDIDDGGLLDLLITDLFYTTSLDNTTNSLGLDVPDEAFLDGEIVDFTFDNPVSAVGLYVITSDPAIAGEIALVTSEGTPSEGTTTNADTAALTLPDGGRAYFMGLVSDTPFTTAGLRFPNPEIHFAYTVDNITTAEATSTVMPGDLDGDSDVDQDDLNSVVGCFGQTAPLVSPCDAADVAPPPDGDGVVNILDISFVGSNFAL